MEKVKTRDNLGGRSWSTDVNTTLNVIILQTDGECEDPSSKEKQLKPKVKVSKLQSSVYKVTTYKKPECWINSTHHLKNASKRTGLYIIIWVTSNEAGLSIVY